MTERTQRRLAAIVSADVVGFSRLMGVDETGTLAALNAHRGEMIDCKIAEYGGRIVKTMGDGLLLEFPSVVDATQCVIEVQRGMDERNEGIDEARRIIFRIGVNLGDIIIEGDDILGDGVNIAARLQEIAEPGGIAISQRVHDDIRDRLNTTFTDAGELALKNIARRVQIWRWSPADRATSATPQEWAADLRISPLPLPEKPSIAVLPFDNMSGDPDQEYFADGVVEALTAALSRIRSFFVIARNSAFAYKGRAMNVRDIGQDLGVAYILEGSVQRAGGRVRITVQLIETEAGAHVWAEKYDGSLDDIFDLQDRITEQVAGALQPSIRLAEVERARRKRPQDLGAYDYAMRAIRHVWMLEKDEATRALELLEKSLEIDPDYPLALALAAWCYAQRSVYNWVEDIESAKAKALIHAESAAALSSDDPLILTVLGTVHTFARNYGAARVMLERAVALDPNAAWAWSRLGWLAAYADRPEEALVHFEKALRLSPIDPMNFNNYAGIASAHQVAGDNNAAADMFLRTLDERANVHWIHRHLAPALWCAGRETEARVSYEALLAAYPNMTVKRFRDATVFSKRVTDQIAVQLSELGLPEN